VTPDLFYLSDLVSPLFFVNSATNFGCHPLGCNPGRSAPFPSDATGNSSLVKTSKNDYDMPRYNKLALTDTVVNHVH